MHTMDNRPIYLHGLEGSPQGVKGAWMIHKYNAIAPSMPAKMGDPNAFPRCFSIAAQNVSHSSPSFIVGSSFGGALLMKLILEGIWRGPSLFIAQAGVRYGLGDRLPGEVPAILIHGKQDTLIPPSDSETIANNSGANTRLWLVDGTHTLHNIIEDGTLERAIHTLMKWPATARTKDH